MFIPPQLQDPLNSIPLLLSCNDPAAGHLLSLIGECCSAKEAVIAVQEAVERLDVSFNSHDGGFEEVEQKVPQQAASSPVVRLSILTGLYAASIPRLKLRKKTAPDTLRPLLTELETMNVIAGPKASTEEGRALISATASLVKRATEWVKGSPDAKEEDVLGCTKLMKNLLDITLTAYVHCIRSSVAQRTFEQCFPRLTIKTSVGAGWEEGEKVVLEALDAYTFLGCTFKELTSAPQQLPWWYLHIIKPVFQSLITILRSSSPFLSPYSNQLHPRRMLIGSAQVPSPHTSVICVSTAHTHSLQKLQCLYSSDINHSESSPFSSLTQPDLRIQLLADLTGDSQLPQMRVAALGLVKEAIVEPLSSTKPDLFASPLFLRAFGPILFRPSPTDLFSGGKELSLSSFQESAIGRMFGTLLRSSPARSLESDGHT
ncbi:hypothetical protein K443DRAFT_9953 [Laccaria amethystina LaAM-08-1]|uniref:Uncharacterized protein n=1 Tax=Laccaria amethystina LaAM-08-1 TaxID=1095629 RepID=A0A0C9WLL5_9AGAR|nr:hypothetical protein K443DRAFT_9953 [Laccaria amethystina LaAM-08-1]